MWAICNNKNIVVATINVEPNKDDLSTRNEFTIKYTGVVAPGMLYKDGEFYLQDENANIIY